MQTVNNEPSGYMLTDGKTIWQFYINQRATSIVSLARARKTLKHFAEDGIFDFKIVAIHELSDETLPA